MKSKVRLVIVLWEDSAGSRPYWEQAVCTATVSSVGHLVRRNKKELVLAQSKAKDGDWGGLFAIPAGCVKSVRRVKEY